EERWSAARVARRRGGWVRVTSRVPVPAGETARIEVSDSTLKLLALAAPNSTAVAPAKSVPLIVTELPPTSEPVLGWTPVTVGGAVAKELSSPSLVPSLLVATRR